jgi:DDE superfamily endonuclease
MKKSSFDKRLEYIQSDLEVDPKMAQLQGGAIIPEGALYCMLLYIPGGSYSDIYFMAGISSISFYHIIWKTISAINSCDELSVNFPQSSEECCVAAEGFASISDKHCISNCISVVDRYHLHIQMPSKKEEKNMKSFLAITYGMNVQGACDHLCQFTYLAVAGPGVMGDQEAIKQVELWSLINNHLGLFCAIGNCAYLPTAHLIPIFGGAQAKVKNHDDLNYFARQCCIQIEMAFGLMVKKWSILNWPLSLKLCHAKHLIVCIAQLHNFCINKQILQHGFV